jgi:hypothetical protein
MEYKPTKGVKMEYPQSWLHFHEGDYVDVFNVIEKQWYSKGTVVETKVEDAPGCIMVHFPVRPANVPECIIVEQSFVKLLH